MPHYKVYITMKRGRREYSVSDTEYRANTIKGAINQAKKEGFRKRQNIPKEYKLVYRAYRRNFNRERL